MKSQRRRLDAQSDQAALNSRKTVEILLDESDAVNIHGVHYCFSIEPEDGGANANGFWVLYCLPAGVINITDLPNDFAGLDNEDFLPYVWGVGCWTASNEAPFHYEFAPSTSRNCQKGARIISTIVATGISAGQVRMNQTLTGFTPGAEEVTSMRLLLLAMITIRIALRIG